MPFQKGNKVGNRFKKGEVSNPMGNNLPQRVQAQWLAVESGIKNAGVVIDLINDELGKPEVQASIRQSFVRCIQSPDPAVVLRTLQFVMAFATKTKHEALIAEFTGNKEALARAVAKLKPEMYSGEPLKSGEITGSQGNDSAQVVDIGLEA